MSRMPLIPNRGLGQHFLVDRNVLGVIGRLARLESSDVVLEVGPGLGALTVFLARRVRLVDAVEIDRSLEPHLQRALTEVANVRLHFTDALKLDPQTLDPPPVKLVANLPYQIATPLLLESLDSLPTVSLWCVMLQREVADRLFAQPQTRAYGAVSVLVQLTARRTGFHPVARTCFAPPPNVDSALVAFERTRDWNGELAPLRRLVQAAFAHRRKMLANSLALCGLCSREQAAHALVELGRSRSVRAEALSPEEYPRLLELLA